MAMVPGGGKKSRAEEDDHISRLPDAILEEIVSLLPTKDGGRTQILSSRWRPIWLAAPLNLDIHHRPPFQRLIPAGEISGILSSHPGPGRRFRIPRDYLEHDDRAAATLDGWLRSPVLDGLQELEFHYGDWEKSPLPPLPASAHRFSSTLRALLGGCPVLQSLMITSCIGCCTRIRIVSSTLRSIGVHISWGGIKLRQLAIEDAPCLERLLLFGQGFSKKLVISVISAPKLEILGQLPFKGLRVEFGATAIQGSSVLNSTMVVPSVKVLALTQKDLSLDVVIDFMKCFPCLEKLYIKLTRMYNQPTKSKSEVTNAWCRKYRNLISALDIRLKKIVVTTYRGNKAHVNFAKFFVLNAGVLESMVLEVDVANYYSKTWIERQHTLLQIDNSASKGARFDFVSHGGWPATLEYIWSDQVHDLSTADPFVGFDKWACSPD
ncbi:unnamed protein product [Urochloa decumbens]|uniref:F-box domain-containing protein n=1 Tax=Urochloa decumbens TaxID=240449 RepID=A0ABC9FL98_9POAL